MYFSDGIKLARSEKTKNELNQYSEKLVERYVYADLRSVSSREFANAGTIGHRAEAVAVIHREDYNHEELIRITESHPVIREGLYRIYRIYEKGDQIELYLKAEVGTE